MADTVEETFCIHVNELYREGRPRPAIVRHRFSGDGRVCREWRLEPGEGSVSCRYAVRVRGRDRPIEKLCYRIRVDWEPCNLGGVRPYLWCSRCGSHRGVKLYQDDAELVCRACAGLLYRSQLVPKHERQLERARDTRKLLGGPTTTLSEFGSGPKGMHELTRQRLIRQTLELEKEAVAEAVRRSELALSRMSARTSRMRRDV